MIKSFTIYSPKNLLRLLSAWLLLATILASGQTHTLDLTSSGTYIVPQGVTSLTVEAWGGGGGGGGAQASSFSTRSGSGGGGGSYSRRAITPLASSYGYSVGSGGSAGDNLNGGDGGTTTFGGSVLMNAPGGKGGKRNSGGAGAGGTGATGATVFNGGSGADGENGTSGGGGGSAGGNGNGGNASGTTGGTPGASGAFSAGAVGGSGSTNGINGTPGISGSVPGAGGSGGIVFSFFGTYTETGGAGAQGRIRLMFTKPSITITPSPITICKGNSVVLTATSAGAYSYTWSNGAGGATVTVSPTNTTTYTVTGTASNGAGGTFTHTQTVTVTVNASASSTVSTPSSIPTVCNNTLLTPITHTTTVATGIGTPTGLPSGVTAEWSNNKITISGTPTEAGTFNYNIPLTGGCGAVAAKGKITVTANLPVSVAISSNSGTNICAGTSVTFTAAPTNGGTTPTYQWKINGGNVVGATSSTFTTTALVDGDKITVVMTSNANSCSTGSPATSNEINMTVNHIPATVTVTGNGQICSGLDAVFTMTGTPGAIVTYNINGGTNSNVTLGAGPAEVKVSAATANQVLNIVSISNGICVNTTTSATTVIVGAVSIYKNGEWSMGLPNNNGLSALIENDYQTGQGNINACNCTVKAGAMLTISANTYMEVLNNITNNGILVVESDGNLKQINDNAVNTGNIYVRRKHNLTTGRKEYNFLSSPMKQQNMKLIFGNNASYIPFVTVLNESNNAFVNATAADWGMAARGFAVKEPTDAYKAYENSEIGEISSKEALYKGVPNNGEITIAVTKSAGNRGWNVIGNPYPSNLDLQLLYQHNSDKIGPEFRFWDNKVNATYTQFGGAYNGYSYAVYNATTGINGFGSVAPGKDGGENTDGGSAVGNKKSFKVVKVSQAFMVRATDTPGLINYKNAYRMTSQTNTTFYGKGNGSEESSFRIQLVTPDQLVLTQGVVYFQGGNNAFGIEDSKHPAPSSSDAFYSFIDDNKVIINGRSVFDRNDVIKLGTQNYIGGQYKIRAIDQEGVFANGQNIYIKDNVLNVIANLSENAYEFTSTSGAFTNRFEIVYESESTTLGTSFVPKANIEIFRDGAEFVIRSSEKQLKEIELFDLSGRLIIKISVDSKEVRFNANRLSEGVYILKSMMKDGEIFLKKIRK